eukprot:TRINITY_DN22583_c0_g1_i1.p1 TRINITY_DN22583_c0_g1~~TRINITY_DN22583_c0_g1_i1.p1  ORF type:complete len:169 (+),score=34.47 TRINITY_DN22583_c0_g1_i1:34-507(+)
MEMLYRTSGKRNYDRLSVELWSGVTPMDRDVLIKMLRREDELRKSPETMRKYSKSDAWSHLRAVTIGIQKQVLKEFGLPVTDQQLYAFQTTRAKYEDDEEIKNLAVYIKFDYSQRGSLNGGEAIPSGITLHNLDGTSFSLGDKVTAKPLIIMAGSYT